MLGALALGSAARPRGRTLAAARCRTSRRAHHRGERDLALGAYHKEVSVCALPLSRLSPSRAAARSRLELAWYGSLRPRSPSRGRCRSSSRDLSAPDRRARGSSSRGRAGWGGGSGGVRPSTSGLTRRCPSRAPAHVVPVACRRVVVRGVSVYRCRRACIGGCTWLSSSRVRLGPRQSLLHPFVALFAVAIGSLARLHRSGAVAGVLCGIPRVDAVTETRAEVRPGLTRRLRACGRALSPRLEASAAHRRRRRPLELPERALRCRLTGPLRKPRPSDRLDGAARTLHATPLRRVPSRRWCKARLCLLHLLASRLCDGSVRDPDRWLAPPTPRSTLRPSRTDSSRAQLKRLAALGQPSATK